MIGRRRRRIEVPYATILRLPNVRRIINLRRGEREREMGEPLQHKRRRKRDDTDDVRSFGEKTGMREREEKETE